MGNSDPKIDVPSPATCANCGARLTGRFCAACGQRVVRDSDFSVWRLTRDWLAATFSVDSRGLVTLRRLLFQPGRLSADYMAGRRGGTFGPFQLFVVTTLLFFLLPDNVDLFKSPARWYLGGQDARVAEVMAALDYTRSEVAIAYNARVDAISKLGIGVLAFVIALAGWICAPRRMPQYGKHLVMGTHTLIFLLVLIMSSFWLLVVINDLTPLTIDLRLSTLTVAVLTLIQIGVSHRRVLGVPSWRAALHAVFVMALLVLAIIQYRKAVNWLALWSL